MDRADGRRLKLRITTLEAVADLRGSPVWLLPLEPDDQLLELERHLVGVANWPPGAVREPFQTAVFVPIEYLVAGFARNIEFPAQRAIFSPSSKRATNLRRSSIL